MPGTANHKDTGLSKLTDLLACPRCQASINELSCGACGIEFPVHDGVPWLVAEPEVSRFEWRNRWQMALQQLESRQQAARAAMEAGARSQATRTRLTNLAAGYALQHRALKTLLSSLGLAKPADLTTYQALRVRLPMQMGLTSYTANVFRDWVWGERENRAAFDAVQAALDDAQIDTLLVLGAGAGRLAYDLHQLLAGGLTPDRTLAADLNPYLTTISRRLAAGETITQVEFPFAPRSGDRSAIERSLQAPGTVRAGFEVILADVLRAPFRESSFDAVVTPWLIDVLDAPPATTINQVARLLKPGGTWVYQGSLAFNGPEPAENINLEELKELIAELGFSVSACVEEQTPYLASPDSRHGRLEQVVTLAATRNREPAASAPPIDKLPDWLLEPDRPVPALAAFRNQAMATRVHAFIMSMIDGNRTVKDMAALMEAQKLMEQEDAEVAIRGFLIKMHDEATASGGF
jgi:SAM-dependent methyltransferase